jgi:hypothetical protein
MAISAPIRISVVVILYADWSEAIRDRALQPVHLITLVQFLPCKRMAVKVSEMWHLCPTRREDLRLRAIEVRDLFRILHLENP